MRHSPSLWVAARADNSSDGAAPHSSDGQAIESHQRPEPGLL
jgi:hypothetical protein